MTVVTKPLGVVFCTDTLMSLKQNLTWVNVLSLSRCRVLLPLTETSSGGHTREVGLGDLRNMQVLANMQRHVLVFDDLPSGYAKFLTALGEAWNQMRADGHIVERYACTEQPTKLKGFTVGYYV